MLYSLLVSCGQWRRGESGRLVTFSSLLRHFTAGQVGHIAACLWIPSIHLTPSFWPGPVLPALPTCNPACPVPTPTPRTTPPPHTTTTAPPTCPHHLLHSIATVARHAALPHMGRTPHTPPGYAHSVSRCAPGYGWFKTYCAPRTRGALPALTLRDPISTFAILPARRHTFGRHTPALVVDITPPVHFRRSRQHRATPPTRLPTLPILTVRLTEHTAAHVAHCRVTNGPERTLVGCRTQRHTAAAAYTNILVTDALPTVVNARFPPPYAH